MKTFKKGLKEFKDSKRNDDAEIQQLREKLKSSEAARAKDEEEIV